MPSSRPLSAWTSATPGSTGQTGPLAERLRELAEDRVSSARGVVLETARVLLEWVHDQPVGWSCERAREALDEGLDDWLCSHAWRGAALGFADTLDALLDEVSEQDLPCRSAVAEELGLWLSDGEPDGGRPWSGRPLDPGSRLVAPGAVAAEALGAPDRGRGLARGETILVLGDSEVVFEALVAADRAGLAPRPRLGEGGPMRGGLRLARRLVDAGLEPGLCYDTRLVADVAAADRVWVASEAVGTTEFTAPAGCGLLVSSARDAEVQVELLTSSDAFTPSGVAELPEWNTAFEWLLWERAPAAVQLHAEALERVPLSLCRHLVLETGRHPARAFAQNTEAPESPRTGATSRPENGPRNQATSSRTSGVPERRAIERPSSTQR